MDRLNEMYATLPAVVWEVPTVQGTLSLGMEVRAKYNRWGNTFTDATIQKENRKKRQERRDKKEEKEEKRRDRSEKKKKKKCLSKTNNVPTYQRTTHGKDNLN